MKNSTDFAFKVSLITTIVLGLIEWRAPGFVSYVFPFPLFIVMTAALALSSNHPKKV